MLVPTYKVSAEIESSGPNLKIWYKPFAGFDGLQLLQIQLFQRLQGLRIGRSETFAGERSQHRVNEAVPIVE